MPALTAQELPEHSIARLYFVALGRIADGAGLTAAYRHLLTPISRPSGTVYGTLFDIAAGLITSPEFQSRYGILSDADYVRAIYRNALGRDPDAATLAADLTYLQGPLTGQAGRATLLLALTESDEARGRLSDNANVTYAGTAEAQVARAYDTAFGRDADPGGFARYTSAVISGTTLRQVALAFLGSAEFAGRYGASPSDQALVDALYVNALGRAPDPAGEAQYLRALASGSFDRADLVVAFSESGEHIGLVAQRAAAQDASGLFLDTSPHLGIIPVLSGSKPYVTG